MLEVLILFEDDGEEIATRLAWAAAERGYAVWGDPNHFRGAEDDEMVAATRAAKAVLLLWTPMMLRVAKSRESVFATLDLTRTTPAQLTEGLELPGIWADQETDMLIGAQADAPRMVGYLEKALRMAGPPSRDTKGKPPVDRMRALEEEAAAWRAIRDLGMVEGYETYLKRFGEKGLFSELARSRRENAADGRVAPLEPERSGGGGVRSAMWFGAGATLATAATAAVLFNLAPAPASDEIGATAQLSAPVTPAPTVSPSALENELADAQSELNRVRSSLADREDAIVKLEMALADARGEVSEAQALVEQTLAESAAGSEQSDAIEQATAALAEARAENERLTQDLQAAEQRMTSLQADLEQSAEAMAQTARDAEAERRRVQSDADAEMEAILAEISAEKEALLASVAEERDALMAKATQEKEALRVEFAQQQDALLAKAASDQDALRAQSAEEQEAMRADFAQEKEALRAEFAQERESLLAGAEGAAGAVEGAQQRVAALESERDSLTEALEARETALSAALSAVETAEDRAELLEAELQLARADAAEAIQALETADAQLVAEPVTQQLPARLETRSAVEDAVIAEPAAAPRPLIAPDEQHLFRDGGPDGRIPRPRPGIE